jgi:hypothetical protein
LPKIAPGDLYVAIIGQLPAAHLALGDEFEPGSMKIIGFETALRGWALIDEPLEYAARDADHSFVLAEPDPEFNGRNIRIPAGVRGEAKEHGAPSWAGMFS